MSQLSQLIEQKALLEKEINQLRQQERASAITQVLSLIQEHELTSRDIFGGGKAARGVTAKKVAPKYVNKETGETWTGRGKPPRWIQGQDREGFKI